MIFRFYSKIITGLKLSHATCSQLEWQDGVYAQGVLYTWSFIEISQTHSRLVLTHNLSFKSFLLSKLLSDDARNGVSTCILQAVGNQKFSGVTNQPLPPPRPLL